MGPLRLRTILAVAFLLCCRISIASGQSRYYDMWYFGNGVGLDFRSGTPTLIRGPMTAFEASASICDRRTGEGLLYTNGDTVWNGRNSIVRDGTGLYGNFSASQGALILPRPGDSLQYFIFTLDGVTVGGQRPSRNLGLNYSIVDFRMDNGAGAVTAKNVPLLSTASEQLVAVRHARGCGYWIMTHELGTNRFFAWHLTQSGLIDKPVVSEIGSTYEPVEAGYLKASPDGKMLFAVRAFLAAAELFSFNASTGRVESLIENFTASYGACFSPNNNLLYYADFGQISRVTLTQFNLTTMRRTILASGNVGEEFRGMQLGPDGRIYVVYIEDGTSRLGVIPYPNVPGMGAGFQKVPWFPAQYPLYYGLQNCVDGYLGTSYVDTRTGSIAITASSKRICSGDSVRLKADAAETYRWEPPDGLSCDDCPDPIASPLETTTYSLSAVNSEGCFETGSITIEVVPAPVADAGPDTTICPGETVQLRARGGWSYVWYPDNGANCFPCDTLVVTPERTMTYQLTAYGPLGCRDVDSVTITVGEVVSVDVSDTIICLGAGATLSASGGKEYLWIPSIGLSCVDCPNPVASPETTTTYVVRGSIDGNCVSYDTVTIVVLETRADAGGDVAICIGDSVQLHGSGGADYSWTPTSDISCPDCSDPLVFPRESVTYYLRVTGEAGCVALDSVRVTVENAGNVRGAGDTVLCAGGSAQLSASGAESYRWNPSKGLSCIDCSNPVATPDETTVYYVIGTNASGRCPSIDSIRVVVRPLPVVEAGGDVVICAGDENVGLRAGGATTYRWDQSPDLSCLDCPDPIASPKRTTMYYVTGIGADGCESRDSVQVIVRPEVVVVAGEDRSICLGDTVRLEAAGGVRWKWEPVEGLSCDDCPDPLASPTKTTSYRVTVWSSDECVGSDSIEVAVREEPEIARLRIGRAYHGRIGDPIVIAVEFDNGMYATDIAELEIELKYDPRVMQIDVESIERLLAGTALEGWSVDIRENVQGRLVLRLTAPAGTTLSGSGELLRLEARLYMSNVRGTELPFAVRSPNHCFVFETEPGYAMVDSICGLNLRLIELTAEKYVPPTAYPNPASDRMTFEFGLGLDGPTRLEVIDALGNRVGLVVDRKLESGRYSVEWDVRDIPSGIYWYRLTSGDWSVGARVLIDR